MSLQSLRVAANPSVSLEHSLHQKIWEESLPRMQLELLHEQGSCSGEKPRLRKEESVGNADSVVLELILGNESVFSRSVWIVPGAVRG